MDWFRNAAGDAWDWFRDNVDISIGGGNPYQPIPGGYPPQQPGGNQTVMLLAVLAVVLVLVLRK